MISRRDFSRLLALSGSVLLPQQLSAWPAPLAQTPPQPDERFWAVGARAVPDAAGARVS